MSLPGLGTFTLDKSVILPDEHDRTLHSMPNAVQFQNANIAAADKELISFICEQTGKIRPLAISDLDSYLNLGTEMLNIGKPFYLEGIGTITRNKSTGFDFAPGEYAVIREHGHAEAGRKKQPAAEVKSESPSRPAGGGQGLRIAGILCALVIVGFGGWWIAKNYNKEPAEQNQAVQEAVAPAADTATTKSNIDSLQALNTVTKKASGEDTGAATYKFIILATENKYRALKRYNQLLGFDLKIHLYQKDSTLFKLYFQFPALTKDTIHIKDSLRREYAHEVQIEQ